MSFFDSDLPLDIESSAGSDANGSSPFFDESDYQDYLQTPFEAADRNSENKPSSGPPSTGRSHRGIRGRGSRGGSAAAGSSGAAALSKAKWRSGQVPAAPSFDGDIDNNPYCLRHYRKRLLRWVRITKEFLPPNEQALRAREQLRGEAETEFEEVSDDRFDHPDGIQRLLDDLQESFGEKEIFRQGGTIREFESIGRLQGETITAFVRRFRLLERRLQETKVPTYPEQARVIKLLDGLRLDERSTSSLLLAAGNRYNMNAVLEAIKIQYPPGMTVTGVPNRPAYMRKTPAKAKTRRAWHASVDEEWAEDDEFFEPEADDSYNFVDENGEEQLYEEAEDDLVYDEEAAIAEAEQQSAEVSPDTSDLGRVVEALTVTSKRLAELTKARGFYQTGDSKKGSNGKSGKGMRSSSSSGKGKGKGKGKGFGKSKKGKSKGSGKPSPTPSRTNLSNQQQRIEDALCLGCGSSTHWIRDCPQQSVYSAQLTTAGTVLDSHGAVVEATNYTVACENGAISLPALAEVEVHQPPPCWDFFINHKDAITRNPKVLIQYSDQDAALMIADTGCQRQVAGKLWHEQRQREILPLQAPSFPEHCNFAFGPNAGTPSSRRFSYPAGLAGQALMLGVSEVEVNAPALFSRLSFEVLGAVPDAVCGVMHYKALGKQSPLYLSRCGHLAIRVDEWPHEEFEWPMYQHASTLPDAWIPNVPPLKIATLKHAKGPAVPPPHASDSRSVYHGMASQLEAPDADGPRGSLCDQADGGELCCIQHEASLQRSDSPQLFSSTDGYHYVDEFNGSADVEAKSEPLPEGAREVRAPSRLAKLWSSGIQAVNLRPVRRPMVPRRGSPTTREHHSKGITVGKDSIGHSSQGKVQSQGQSDHGGRELNSSATTIGRLLGWLTTTFATVALTCNQAYEGTPGTSTLAQDSTQPTWSFPVHGQEQVDSTSPIRSLRGYPHGQHERSEFSRPLLAGTGSLGAGDGLPGGASFPTVSDGLLRHGQRGIPRQRGMGRAADSFRSGGGDSNVAAASGHGGGGGNRRSTLSPMRHLCGSADAPLLKEDRDAKAMKKGTQKRLLGDIKSMRQWLTMETRAYESHVLRARLVRRYKCDVVEIYGGFANITAEAISRGLKALQPVDKVYGIPLNSRADHERLRGFLLKHRPFLVIWEFRCDPWSRIQHLNYDSVALERLREEQRESLEEGAKTIEALHREGCHFLIENPWGTPFWEQVSLRRVQDLPGVQLRKGAMCNFGLRGGNGLLLKKETGWCGDLPAVLDRVCLPCTGDHPHEECLGSNAKRGQIYTKKLARAVVDGLCDELQALGDERFQTEPERCLAWTAGSVETSSSPSSSWTAWTATTDQFSVWYADVCRDVEAWRPLLGEAQNRLQNKVQATMTVKPSMAYHEQIRALVPWTLELVQIAKTPKVRRLPTNLMMEKFISHRAAILLHNNDQISIETEAVSDLLSGSGAKFEAPVAFAIFIYGAAPATSFEPEENKQPEKASKTKDIPQAEHQLPEHQPGSQDIVFPDVSEQALPKWMRSVLKRLHVNLGHPSNQAMVRHLAQAGASGPALLGARQLRCATCERTKMPPPARPTKCVQARRFNDRLLLDIIYIRDVASAQHMFLSEVDAGTTYHVVDYLDTRSEDEVVRVLTQGWFRFFGFPDEMVVDAEGAMRSWGFEQLCAQAGIRVRHVPPDAHYQFGRAERHGQAVKWIMRRLINQYSAITSDDMKLLANLACSAKNSLARRSGASPCQWVFGRNPKIPSSLLSEPDALEAKQVISDSQKLMEIESMRHSAMQEFIAFEHNEALRKAVLRKSRPWRGPIEVGQRVAYFRQKSQMDGEGSAEGYRQGLVIGLDPGPTGSVWVRNNRGRLVQVAREQIRGIEGEELWAPSSDDIAMLKSAEADLSSNQPPLVHDHRGEAPRMLEDRLILDAAGEPAPLRVLPAPLLALPPISEDVSEVAAPSTPAITLPVPGTPRTTRRAAMRKLSEQVAGPPALIKPKTNVRFEDQVPHEPAPQPAHEAESGWFLDPDGRPTVVVENARRYRSPDPHYDSNTFKYRTTWSFDSGRWEKLEDQVNMSEIPEKDEPLGRSVDRLVTTFSREPAPGRRPSIESARGVKRGAEQTKLPDREDAEAAVSLEPPLEQPPTLPPEDQTPQQSPETVAPTDQAVALTYCQNCGSQDHETRGHGLECVRCNSLRFVSDPLQVSNWFDEVEEREAYEHLREPVHFNKKIKSWTDYPLSNIENIELPKNEDLDVIHDTESFVLDIGQAFQCLPTQVDPQSIWSIATKGQEDDDWKWLEIFATIDVAADTVKELDFIKNKVLALHHKSLRHARRPRRALRRFGDKVKRWLHRHGRHCAFVQGWDGSPPELQPMFMNEKFSQAYHLLVQDVANNQYATLDEQVNSDAQSFKAEGSPAWTQTSWLTSPMVSVFNTQHTEEQQVITGPASSEDEEEEKETGGRALKQALKRETPWRTISKSDWPGFVKAMVEEWSEWKKWSSCQPVWPKPGEVPAHLILKSRVCYGWKPKDGGKWFKPKARIVVAGYADPHLPLLSRDAPVLAKTTLILIIQWAAIFQVSLWNGDCKSAFLQGQPDHERPTCIYMRPPKDDISREAVPEWSDDNLLYQLTAPVYGQANAPRQWYLHVLHVLTNDLGWHKHSLDPCCFYFVVDEKVVAVLGVHVDDIITCCLPGHEAILEGVKNSFAWGSEWEKDSFVFVGRRIERQENGGFTMDQMHYVAEVEKTKFNQDPDAPLSDFPDLVTEFRSGIGSLQWLAGTTRGDLSADVSLLQKPPRDLKVSDLQEINRTLKYVKATAQSFVRVNPFKLEDIVFIAYGDSGWANAPGNKSQGGLVIVMTDKHVLSGPRPASLLEWKSYRHQRVLRSTLAAEAASLDRTSDMANFMSCVFGEMTDANYKATCGIAPYEVIPVTDARSLWDAIHRLSTSFSEKRVEIDVANLRQTCRNLRWVPTEEQWADALTKRCGKLRDLFRKWAMDPIVTLVEAKSAEDGEDNFAWRDRVQDQNKSIAVS